ncbi:MAG TPA: ice-binding family protein [Bacteroidia bacterium]|nr:ice-binding family protein [Bacteroidia bacterium]
MKTKNVITTIALASIALVAGCKKSTTTTSPATTTPNPVVIPTQTTVQTSISLASTSTFAILAGSAINSTGATNINGDLGLSPGSSVGGFPPGVLVGTQHINDPIAAQAKLDLTAAYNDAAGRTCTDIVTLSGNLGGLTLTPGLYKSTSSLAISSGDLTFDAKGNANAVFIIQIASTLTTTSGRQVILSGGALASNIFWQVGSSATFGTTSVFKGTVMAMQSITFDTGASIDGRALARTGAVVMAGNAITKQ